MKRTERAQSRSSARSALRIRRPGLNGKRARGAALLVLIASAALFSNACCRMVPWALAVDPSLTGNSNGNGILEPGETVAIAPSWSKRNYLPTRPTPTPGPACSTSWTETGTATSLTGSIQADYVIGHVTGSYETFGPVSTSRPGASVPKQCTDCYEMFVSLRRCARRATGTRAFGRL